MYALLLVAVFVLMVAVLLAGLVALVMIWHRHTHPLMPRASSPSYDYAGGVVGAVPARPPHNFVRRGPAIYDWHRDRGLAP